ncbi:MAG: flavodoxin reductase [Verrucomicrobiota bacterium JB023]|nr:flavodoxin reductase [Verrucomicrobiota bacterium JB023]
MDYSVKVLAVTQDTHETYKFAVEKPEGYEFTPGQATCVSINKPGAREEKRPFTFTSLPDDPCLQFTIKTYPERDGVTDEMRDLQVDDELLIGEPWGAINYKGPGLFIAGGAGITPFLSIFRQLHREGSLTANHLLYSNSQQRDIIAAAELKTQFGPNVHFYLTDETVPTYQQGHIDEGVLRGFLDTVKPEYCYVCGTPGMTEEIVSDLKKLGVPEEAIIQEES